MKSYFDLSVHQLVEVIAEKNKEIEKLKNFGNKKKNFKNYKELRKAVLNINDGNLSHSEKLCIDLLRTFSSDYGWRFYVALNDFIDRFLF